MDYLQRLEQLNTANDLEAFSIERVLVIVAHPDDIESWCAGAICRFTDAGKQVAYVLCTSGDKGTSDPHLTTQQVAKMREAEQIDAARIVGVKSVTFLHWLDSEVESTLALRRELVRQIRRHRPDLVITHDPAPPYRLHPDHRAVGRATLDALFPCARDPLTFSEQIHEEGLQAHLVPEAWLFATEVPDIWIDIESTLERKIAARLAHTSQHTDAAELARSWRERAAQIGEPVRLEAAEAFKRVDLR
jgi:LmbE family N-acetylglucosaminyl deacetylase